MNTRQEPWSIKIVRIFVFFLLGIACLAYSLETANAVRKVLAHEMSLGMALLSASSLIIVSVVEVQLYREGMREKDGWALLAGICLVNVHITFDVLGWKYAWPIQAALININLIALANSLLIRMHKRSTEGVANYEQDIGDAVRLILATLLMYMATECMTTSVAMSMRQLYLPDEMVSEASWLVIAAASGVAFIALAAHLLRQFTGEKPRGRFSLFLSIILIIGYYYLVTRTLANLGVPYGSLLFYIKFDLSNVPWW